MGQEWSKLYPPTPTLTAANLPDQRGKVFLVTGGSGGLGKELATILYHRNAKVYIAARSASKAEDTIDEIQRKYPDSAGHLVHLPLDLNDLTSIKKSADEFLAKETRLDVLWNNAGVMVPPQGSKTLQGYELQLGTNNLAPFLFTHYLLPLMKETAKKATKNSVRIVWVSSSLVSLAPKPPIDFFNMDYKRDEGPWRKYARSKVGNVLHAVELAKRIATDGIINLSLDPGILKTDLQRFMPWWQYCIVRALLLYPAINRACTELYAGLQPDITEQNNGGWIAPFGRLEEGRKDLWDPELGLKYWNWTEDQLKDYL